MDLGYVFFFLQIKTTFWNSFLSFYLELILKWKNNVQENQKENEERGNWRSLESTEVVILL